jgi:hypothetical protein
VPVEHQDLPKHLQHPPELYGNRDVTFCQKTNMPTTYLHQSQMFGGTTNKNDKQDFENKIHDKKETNVLYEFTHACHG